MPLLARKPLARLVVTFFAALLAVPLLLAHAGQQGRAEQCTAPAKPIRVGNTIACAHADEAPQGVDVTERPSTTELQDRAGAGAAAYAAAQDLGVPATYVATTASSPSVTCDGDGTSGYRVQAMYVVEADKTNRYDALKSSFQLWAAGVDDVVNRSAALTGGVRHVRYVTEAGGGGCVAKVLNVTVPAGSMASFGATISAVQALGYNAPGRKYLMWTDATALCGIASMYTNDTASQANPNNGSYPQYARIDSGCWGFGDGSTGHSVESHELLHTLGGVQNTAPHATTAGHCWDESDAMCYADGGGHAMVQVCPADREYFYDCNADDYFSTYPDPGSYLDTHWDSADSRFLIGGGDGSGGGDPGSPTTLGASIAVNNPAIPGLATQASVTPSLPNGRTLTSVVWTSKRADCSFGAPTQIQTSITCDAKSATATTVTAVLTDSTGATKTVTSPLTFATGTPRAVTLAIGGAGQTGATASVCTGAAFPLRATLVDTASGQPIKGLAVAFTKKLETATTEASAGAATSTVEGAAVSNQTATAVTRYTAKTTASTVYAAATPASVTATPGKCSPELQADTDKTTVFYGDPVTVTGTLTRQVGGADVPVAGASLPVKLTTVSGATTKVTSLGNAVVAADGSFSLAVKPTASGNFGVELVGTAGYTATKVDLGAVTVNLPQTDFDAEVAPSDVGYGSGVTVSGALKRDAGGTVTSLTGATVTVKVKKDGATTATSVGTAKVTADGSYSVVVPLKVSGAMTASYAGAAGQPAASVDLGAVTAGTWTTAVTAAASAAHVVVGGSALLTGSVSKTYGGATSAANAIKVTAYFTPSGGSPVAAGSATTTATGTFSIKVLPKASGTWTVKVTGVAGYGEAASSPMAVSVG
ncbi:hypothetical protein [Nocardioides marmorisolisilvae]|uniref:Uncharacterized protein n=1 Tax=Nocardioides marmorisolisilvae TaxID=1542737 RepID=A0A3N0DV82_9ACTN|nr:hypothetical protein [Nocardioides marmorisolisilvae]RNL79529.1 hypothetical protein EFL95_11145 [Nocardioides marmorisolisilvae]